MIDPKKLSDAIYNNFAANNQVGSTFRGAGVVASRLTEAAYIEHWLEPDDRLLKRTLDRITCFNLNPIFDQEEHDSNIQPLTRLNSFTSGNDKRIPSIPRILPDCNNPEEFETGLYSLNSQQSREKVFIFEGPVTDIPFLRVAIYKQGVMPPIVYYKHELENIWLLSDEFLTFKGMREFFQNIVDSLFKKYKINEERDWPAEIQDLIDKSQYIFDIKFALKEKDIQRNNTPSFHIEFNNYQLGFSKFYKDDGKSDQFMIKFFIMKQVVNGAHTSVDFYALGNEEKEMIVNYINVVFDTAISTAAKESMG